MKYEDYKNAASRHVKGCSLLIERLDASFDSLDILLKISDFAPKMLKYLQGNKTANNEQTQKKLNELIQDNCQNIQIIQECNKNVDSGKKIELPFGIDSLLHRMLSLMNTVHQLANGNSACDKESAKMKNIFEKKYSSIHNALLEIYYLLGYAFEGCVVYALLANEGWYSEVNRVNAKFVNNTKCIYYKDTSKLLKQIQDNLKEAQEKLNSTTEDCQTSLSQIKELEEFKETLEKGSFSVLENHNFYEIILNYCRIRLADNDIPLLSKELKDKECEFLIRCWNPKIRYAYEDKSHSWTEFFIPQKSYDEDINKLNSLLTEENMNKLIVIANDICKNLINI